jgi:hypothetical protein
MLAAQTRRKQSPEPTLPSTSPTYAVNCTRYSYKAGHRRTTHSKLYQERPSDFSYRPRSALPHRERQFRVQDLKHALGARLPKRTQAPQIGPADAYGARSERQCLEYIRSPPEPAIH